MLSGYDIKHTSMANCEVWTLKLVDQNGFIN